MWKKILLIVVMCFLTVFFSGCVRLARNILWADSLIDVNYKSREVFFNREEYGNLRYSKFNYSKKIIKKYANNDAYILIDESNIENITGLVKWFEKEKDIYRNGSEASESFDNDYDFNLEKIKYGDYYAVQYLNVCSSSNVIPEEQHYQDVNIYYVSLDENIVYQFDLIDGIYCVNDTATSSTLTLLSDKKLFYHDDDFNSAVETCSKNEYEDKTVEELLNNGSYYYALSNAEGLQKKWMYIENESINNFWSNSNCLIMEYMCAVASISAESRQWDEEEFFEHYSLFFGNNDVSYFTFEGRNYMKIQIDRSIYYFFMQDGDYIIELWDTFHGEAPVNSQLAVEKVYYR